MLGPDLIIDGRKRTFVEKSEIEKQIRLVEIEQAKEENRIQIAKEKERQQAIARLKQSSDQNIADILVVLGL